MTDNPTNDGEAAELDARAFAMFNARDRLYELVRIAIAAGGAAFVSQLALFERGGSLVDVIRSAVVGALVAAWRAVTDRVRHGGIVRALVTRVRTGLRSPDALGWGDPGKPGSAQGRLFETANIVRVHAGPVRIRCHRHAARLLVGFLTECQHRGYVIHQVDTASFVHRYMRALGRTLAKLSAHSWGTAVDVNWSTNPQSRRLITDMPPWMQELAPTYGLVWGGRFSLPDAMHYQLNVTPTEADHLADMLKLPTLAQIAA